MCRQQGRREGGERTGLHWQGVPCVAAARTQAPRCTHGQGQKCNFSHHCDNRCPCSPADGKFLKEKGKRKAGWWTVKRSELREGEAAPTFPIRLCPLSTGPSKSPPPPPPESSICSNALAHLGKPPLQGEDRADFGICLIHSLKHLISSIKEDELGSSIFPQTLFPC